MLNNINDYFARRNHLQLDNKLKDAVAFSLDFVAKRVFEEFN
jgi:hypothetical protein